MKNTLFGSIYLALAASIWGGMYVVVKVVVAVIPPLELVWLRYAVALLSLLILSLFTRQSWKVHKRDLLLIAAIGLIGNTVSIVTQEIGTKLSTAQMGAIITASTPAFMVVFARLMLKERLTLKKGISTGLATIGVLLIVGNGDLDMSSQLGGLSLLAAALTWALMSVLMKRVPGHYSPLVVTTYSICVAFVILTPFTAGPLREIPLSQLARPEIWGGLLYLGVISTACAFMLWNRGLQLLNAASGGLFFFFQPLSGTLLGWLLLGESIGGTFWIGAALTVSGVVLVMKEK
ncbi:DMT family transporter [Bacillus velezensis]|uniref:DMT family transporter n=1 Tax=Bacillus velezensis TaxID=492670 RepID=UPI003DA879B5